MRINRILFPITTLGPGRRLGLWVQGCTLACPGCASQDTWDPDEGSSVTVDVLTNAVADTISRQGLAGLTITGGEPLQQPRALVRLLRQLNLERQGGVTTMLFTGYPLAVARRLCPELVELCDVVIAGRYREDLPAATPLVASTNQQIHFASQRVQSEFEDWQNADPVRLQLAADEHDLTMVGVPAPGDLDRFAAGMQRRGIRFDSLTWRP